jgi:hypothetical protein
MSRNLKELWALELDVTAEALAQGWRVGPSGYWVIHVEEDGDGMGGVHLCVYETSLEADEAAQGRDHDTRVTRFVRAGSRPSRRRRKKTTSGAPALTPKRPRRR